ISNGPVDVYAFRNGGSPTNAADYIKNTYNFDETAYFNQPVVKYAGANDNGLRQIISQKYLSFFQNSGLEGYFNYRRTGYPTYSINGPGTGNSGLIPKRFQYPASERTNNAASWKAAVDGQFAGKDDINADMWLLK
ncbi:MAG: SusD/RagB family nutrient-binding outer membrane lipoprotein, partial [Bacteroidota bacterium]